MREKGIKMKVNFEWKGEVKWGKSGFFAALFYSGKQQNFRIRREIVVKINQRIRCLHKTTRINNFAIKLVPWRLQNVLATIWYGKFYWWLTVAPLGDGDFLKASRTSDLHSLGGWSVPHPLGCLSLLGWSYFVLKCVSSYEKQWIFIKKLSTYP